MWYLQRHYLVWMFYSFSLGYKGNSWFQAHVPLIIQTDAFPILIDLCIEHELLIQKGFPVFPVLPAKAADKTHFFSCEIMNQ